MKLTRRQFLASGVAAALGGFGYSTAIEPGRVVLERVPVRVPRLPPGLEGFRIAVLSDFHLQPYTQIEHIEHAVRVANGLQADLVVLLGDYVTSSSDSIHELAPALAKLQSAFGTFGVLGNHDVWHGAEIVRGALAAAGITMLVNEGVTLPVRDTEIYLGGVDDVWSGRPDLSRTLAGQRAGTPAVLLAHEPDYGDLAARDGRVALQLSGHTHGGQIRLPFLGPLRLPTWGQRYPCGLYRVQEMALYTSRGLGMIGVPVRFHCPPEVTEITLRAG